MLRFGTTVVTWSKFYLDRIIFLAAVTVQTCRKMTYLFNPYFCVNKLEKRVRIIFDFSSYMENIARDGNCQLSSWISLLKPRNLTRLCKQGTDRVQKHWVLIATCRCKWQRFRLINSPSLHQLNTQICHLSVSGQHEKKIVRQLPLIICHGLNFWTL
jgi:hypothetical protein